MNEASIPITEYTITREMIDSLSEDQRAAFALLTFALGEINTLQKLSRQANFDSEGEAPLVSEMVLTRNLVLMRCISSKLLGVRELLRFHGQYNCTEDEILLWLRSRAETLFGENDASKGHEFARYIRDKGCFHYDLDAARDGAKLIGQENHHTTFYFLPGDKTAFSSYGEEVHFVGHLMSFAKKQGFPDEKAVLRIWSEWIADTVRILRDLMQDFWDKLAKEMTAPGERRKITVAFPSELVGRNERTLPIVDKADLMVEGMSEDAR